MLLCRRKSLNILFLIFGFLFIQSTYPMEGEDPQDGQGPPKRTKGGEVTLYDGVQQEPIPNTPTFNFLDVWVTQEWIVGWEDYFNDNNPLEGFSRKKYQFPKGRNIVINDVEFESYMELKSKMVYRHFTKDSNPKWVHDKPNHNSYQQFDIYLLDDRILDGSRMEVLRKSGLRSQRTIIHGEKLEYIPIGGININGGVISQEFSITKHYVLPDSDDIYPGEKLPNQTLALTPYHIEFVHNLLQKNSRQKVRLTYRIGNAERVLFETFEIQTVHSHLSRIIRWEDEDDVVTSTPIETIYFIANGLYNSPPQGTEIIVDLERRGSKQKYNKLSSTPTKEGFVFKDTLITEVYARPGRIPTDPNYEYTKSYYK